MNMPEIEEFKKSTRITWGLFIGVVMGAILVTYIVTTIYWRFQLTEQTAQQNRSNLINELKTTRERVEYVNDRIDRKTEPIWKEIQAIRAQLKEITEYHEEFSN